MAGLTPVEFGTFGGLDLRSDPQQVGTVDGTDFDLSYDGRLRARDGYASFGSALAANFTRLFGMPVFPRDPATASSFACFLSQGANASGNWQVSGTLANGTTASTTLSLPATMPAGTEYWVATSGTPSTSRIMVATNGTTNIVEVQPDSTTGSMAQASAGSWVGIGGGPVAFQPADNRLVVAAASSGKLSFSDAGTHTVFGANNFVTLTPNDGEVVREIVNYDQRMFVFKQTKFFEFYGNSVDGSGNPIFNYRVCDYGQGVSNAQGAIATTEGIYLANKTGLWLTTGGKPVKLSDPVDPLFSGRTSQVVSTALTNIIANASYYRLALHGRKIVLYTGAGALVMDRDTRQWTAITAPIVGAAAWNPSSAGRVPSDMDNMFFTTTAATNLFRMSSASTTDNGSAISARWRSGFWNPGQAGAESIVHEWLFDGTGVVSVKAAVNDSATLGSAVSVTLGTSPAVAQGRDVRAVRGRNVSLELSGAAPWSVSRVVANVWGQNDPGLKSS